MSAWLLVAVALAVVVTVLVLIPWRLRLSLQGRGEPSGFWALGGGAQVGPLAVSGVAARGVPATFQAHLGKRKIWTRTLAQLMDRREPEPSEDDELSTSERAERTWAKAAARYAKLERWIDPWQLAQFLVKERRRIEIELVEVDLDYDFADIALTGKVLGAIYAFSPLLPGNVVIRQQPGWEFKDRASVAGSGSIKVWPGLLVVDAAWFVIRNGRVRRRPGAAKGALKVS